MFGGMKEKELILVFTVVGFGSVALVALGELSNVDADSALFKFYVNLVFGGLTVFYAVFIHFATISFTQKIDKGKKSEFTKFMLGEKSSFRFVMIILGAVLVFWIYNVSTLMDAFDLKLF